jgi:two-component system cell cycle sensor histidine kinase/response regulator CckA
MGSFVDITERKQAEEALRESELKFRSLFDLSPQPVALTDLNTGILLDANRRFCEVTQYTRENILGNTVTDLGLWSEEERGRFVGELIKRGEVNGINVHFKAKDGTILDVLLFAKTIQLGGKRLIFGTFVDFSKQRRLEARLHHAQRMEALGTLAGGIAHNFNNLLMGIQGNASLMLLDTPPNNPHYKRLLNIEQQVESGSKLAKQLLGYAREGRHEIQPIDLNRLIKETSGTFGATRKEIRVHQELAKDLYIVTGDQGQIEQALLNLYINAADAMPGGGDLFIKTANVTSPVTQDQHLDHKPGEYVLLSVSDTGIGMDKKTMERIFDPFFTTKDMSKGTGLGLASVYGIIRNHDGTINVYSEKGEGTTFVISLPASRHQALKEDIESTGVIPGKGNILLVDDEEMILDVASQMLEKMGYHVLKAKSGEEAIELYKENMDTIDLVILDMIMPGVGGGKTCDTIKEINPSIKILLSSGYSLENQATEIRGRSWDGFIQKPFKINRLSRKIREILDSDKQNDS